MKLDAAVLLQRYLQLFPSKLDDGLEYSFPKDLPTESRPASIWAGAIVLEADLEEVLELGVTGWSSIHELLQAHIGDD